MTSETNSRQRRSDLKRDYREKPPPPGVYAVRCTANGKLAVGSAMNVRGALNRLQFELQQHMHQNFPGLQEDYDRLGAASFTFQTVDVLEPAKDSTTDPRDDLKVLEQMWLDRLKPYGDAGYNVYSAPPR